MNNIQLALQTVMVELGFNRKAINADPRVQLINKVGTENAAWEDMTPAQAIEHVPALKAVKGWRQFVKGVIHGARADAAFCRRQYGKSH